MAATAFLAASSRFSAAVMGRPLSVRMRLASWTLSAGPLSSPPGGQRGELSPLILKQSSPLDLRGPGCNDPQLKLGLGPGQEDAVGPRPPSSDLLRTTSGTFSSSSRHALVMPLAMMAQLTMPPKMLTRMASTCGTEDKIKD
ncbi:hypothetical protein EYF80_050639 [Liparis tanakae]|uniref:Uncharacterized protein n=1 Tax=Liparis tanakae TaxID=230148 RepID=A0A4Z2FEJ7_9TELE|nr:hypothetical protein EYF80_050639 [Liparis tanakae]